MAKETGWAEIAEEYTDSFIRNEGSYHSTVILPNILRVVEPTEGKKILEIGCGDGYFSIAFEKKGAEVWGCDIAGEMIAKAKNKSERVKWFTTPADALTFSQDNFFDIVVVVLALQNIENLDGVLAEASRVLKIGGELVCVLNHPAFRIPKRSSWEYDKEKDVQYRRLDAYLSESSEEIDMDPGKEVGKRMTISFHRPLQMYVKTLSKNNFGIVGMEEWISNKKSEVGPRQKAEDMARKEFPLFLMLKAQKLA